MADEDDRGGPAPFCHLDRPRHERAADPAPLPFGDDADRSERQDLERGRRKRVQMTERDEDMADDSAVLLGDERELGQELGLAPDRVDDRGLLRRLERGPVDGPDRVLVSGPLGPDDERRQRPPGPAPTDARRASGSGRWTSTGST
jgi:hypothetical protein